MPDSRSDASNNNNAGTITVVRPDPSSLPLRGRRSNPDAEITVQSFADRLVITISSSNGKIGRWLYCKPAIVEGGGFESSRSHTDWEVTHLLGSGREDPYGTVLARRISHLLYSEEGGGADDTTGMQQRQRRPILLGLSPRRQDDREGFTRLVDVVVQTVRATWQGSLG